MNQTDIAGKYNYLLRGCNCEALQGQYWLSYFLFRAAKTHPSTLLAVSKTAGQYDLERKKDENEAKVLQKFAHIYLSFQHAGAVPLVGSFKNELSNVSHSVSTWLQKK